MGGSVFTPAGIDLSTTWRRPAPAAPGPGRVDAAHTRAKRGARPPARHRSAAGRQAVSTI
ncbi:hypothetical protein C9J60_31400 [Streptomyces sp. A244]|nr:hypothetical protein C9J60_31400 [Streptomyces sp. A244]